jgi:two-component system response regulator
MKAILQVEDDLNDVIFLKHAFKKAEVANPLRVVNDGREAIDYLKGAGRFADREQFPLPGLVLLDLKLPRVMGMEVLKWIRQESGLSLVVVLLTASAEEADIAAAYRLGANSYLVKPSEATKLVEMAKAIKDFWLTFNTLPQQFHRDREAPVRPYVPGVAHLTAANAQWRMPNAPSATYEKPM